MTLALLLSALAENCGADLLRMKGIVHVAEEPDRPAVIHGVQHVYHAPVWLERWPSADRRTRMVFIGRNLRESWVKSLIDLLDAEGLRPLLEQARRQGIAVNVFDSEPPASLPLTSIGNDYCLQARIASERLVQLLGGKGEVAIMQGVPTAPNHAIRARCHRQVFASQPGIQVVASPVDNDSISTAEEQARSTMVTHPQLKGWVVSDAGGGIGVARAIAALGKTGSVKVVALDDLPELLQLIKSGAVDSTAATKPFTQGYWAVLNLWQQGLGAPPIERIDTGIGVQGGAAKAP